MPAGLGLPAQPPSLDTLTSEARGGEHAAAGAVRVRIVVRQLDGATVSPV
jgi:hypothetical protein